MGFNWFDRRGGCAWDCPYDNFGQSRQPGTGSDSRHEEPSAISRAAEKGGWLVMPAPKTKIWSRELEDVVADTWKKLGPAPE
jgi:hypothetical protein